MKQVCRSTEKDVEGWEDHAETTKLDEYTKVRNSQKEENKCNARLQKEHIPGKKHKYALIGIK